MKWYSRIMSCLLIAGLLPVMNACTTQVPDEAESNTISAITEAPTENHTEGAQTPPRETYEELSFGVPAYQDPGTKSVTVQSGGKGESCRVTLDFTALNGQYVISPTKIGFSCHDVASCKECGYVETEDGGAYLLSSDGLDQGGITVTLVTPILASSVTGMTLTFKTTADAKNSSMRILTSDQTNNAAFVNACPPMGGATMEWVTIDLGMKDFSEIADSEGYIRGFQMYFRNKSKADCYVQSISFTLSPDAFLTVDEVAGNCFYRQGAVDAVAAVIASRFAEADMKAEIKVEGAAYRQNSCSAEGSLRYKATVTLADDTVLSLQHTAVIPAITGAWLDATDGEYGASHDSCGQWQDTFDPSGLLFLTDNRLTSREGIDRVEYTVIKSDLAYDNSEIPWFAPQMLEMKDDGFAHFFANAYLDMGDTLNEGTQYYFLVRGVTKGNNYVLHINIPFTYSPLSSEVEKALQTAKTAVMGATLVCPRNQENKADYVKEKLSALIGNTDVAVDVDLLGEGVHSMRLRVALQYRAGIYAPRLPLYTLNGQRMTDVYHHEGRAFIYDDLTVRYDGEQSSISLVSPYDGERHIVLAADCIYQHAKAPLSVIQTPYYGYLRGEHCTPLPVHLSWTDENGREGKTYTISISKYSDMSNAREITVTGTRAEVYHLNIDTQYFWQVSSDGKSSLVQTFTTEGGYPRFIKMDGVSNVRDIGGYLTADGKRVKQNLAYRSAQLESITEEGLRVALDELHIRTDLDLRGGSTAPLGKTVKHISVPMQWYEHIFEEDMHQHVRKTIATFAYEENYPILFHCSMGRDRTGTTAFLILGLLGVEEDTLRHEYYASFFSTQGAFDQAEFPLLITNMNRLVKGFDAYGDADDTLQEKIEAYLLHIGVTKTEIQSIRDIWLEP